MSYTEIYKFKKNGDAEFIGETKNAHRGATAVWLHLEKKYLPPVMIMGQIVPRQFCFDNNKGVQEIWDLYKNPKVSEIDKICFLSTFDNAVVQKENIEQLITAFRAFDGDTSLKEQSDIIEKAFKEDTELLAIAFNQNSISGDEWDSIGGFDEEKGKRIPYNILTGTEHWFVFENASDKVISE